MSGSQVTVVRQQVAAAAQPALAVALAWAGVLLLRALAAAVLLAPFALALAWALG